MQVSSPKAGQSPRGATDVNTSTPPKNAPPKTDKRTGQRLRDIWPEIREMIRPRRRILALGFALMLVNRVCGLILPVSSKYFVDDVVIRRDVKALGLILLAVLVATIIQGCTSFALTQVISKTAQRLIAELRLKVQAHISRLPISFYDANKTGNLVARIMTDVEGVRNLLGTGMIEFIGGLLTAVIVLVLLFRTSVLMTVIAMGVLIGFAVLMQKALESVRPIFRERWQINAEVTGRLTESLGGVRVVKGYHAEERERKVFAQGVQRLMDNVFKTLTATSLMGLAATILTGFLTSIIMYLGAHQVLEGKLMLGDFIKYVTLLTFVAGPIFQIVSVGTQLTEAISGLDRTRELLREKPEDEDPRQVVALPEIVGLVEFDHVHFCYEEGKNVLNDISLVAEPDTITALVGPSGSGKSTLIGLVAAFHTPQAGMVRIDGVDLSSVRLDSYRTQLGLVLQETFLFDGTVWQNVAFGGPGASREEILEACRIAAVDEFVERFEDGYETIIGERGVKLSGGQRQRVSIARAILAKPRILILDEATSSLDSESEALIQHGLRYLMKGRTTFVVAHRLSTIRYANQILVLDKGHILERGTHEDLYAAGRRYWSLYTKQYGLVSDLFLAPGEGDNICLVETA